MLFDEKSNKYSKKKVLDQSQLTQCSLISVKEYGEYKTESLNIRKFSKFEFKGYILMMVVSGSGVVSIDRRIVPMAIGDILIFNNDSSQVISNENWKVCYVLLDGENVHKIMTALFNGRVLYHFHNMYHFYELYNLIYQSLENSICASLDSCSYVLQLLSNIVKYNTEDSYIKSFEIQILGYIENYYTSDISIEDMATYCGYSQYYFIREFKRVLKDTPYNYLTLRRISYAKQLLALGELTIEEISEMTGFNSVSNFCVAFKKKENRSPKNFQKNRRLKTMKMEVSV